MKTNLFVFVSSSTDVRMRTPNHRAIALVQAPARIRIDGALGIPACGASFTPLHGLAPCVESSTD